MRENGTVIYYMCSKGFQHPTLNRNEPGHNYGKAWPLKGGQLGIYPFQSGTHLAEIGVFHLLQYLFSADASTLKSGKFLQKQSFSQQLPPIFLFIFYNTPLIVILSGGCLSSGVSRKSFAALHTFAVLDCGSFQALLSV